MKRFNLLAAFAALAVLFAPLAFTHSAQASQLTPKTNGNLCVDLNQSSGQVALWTCNAGANENFFGAYGQQKFNGQCLDQASTAGSNMWLVFKPCKAATDKTSNTQRWGVSAAGELKNEAGFCLDIPFNNTASGQRLQMFSCNNGANQKFNMGPAHAAVAVNAAPPAAGAPKLATPTTAAGGGLVSNASGTIINPNLGANQIKPGAGGSIMNPNLGAGH